MWLRLGLGPLALIFDPAFTHFAVWLGGVAVGCWTCEVAGSSPAAAPLLSAILDKLLTHMCLCHQIGTS